MGLKTLLFPWLKPKKKVSWLPMEETERILGLMSAVEQSVAYGGVGLAERHYKLWLEVNRLCPPTIIGAKRSIGYSGDRGSVFVEEEIR